MSIKFITMDRSEKAIALFSQNALAADFDLGSEFGILGNRSSVELLAPTMLYVNKNQINAYRNGFCSVIYKSNNVDEFERIRRRLDKTNTKFRFAAVFHAGKNEDITDPDVGTLIGYVPVFFKKQELPNVRPGYFVPLCSGRSVLIGQGTLFYPEAVANTMLFLNDAERTFYSGHSVIKIDNKMFADLPHRYDNSFNTTQLMRLPYTIYGEMSYSVNIVMDAMDYR